MPVTCTPVLRLTTTDPTDTDPLRTSRVILHRTTPLSPTTLSAAMPPELVERMCHAIVGFDVPITELQSKWKFSQDRGADDRTGVGAALEELGGDSNLAVAATMRMRDQ